MPLPFEAVILAALQAYSKTIDLIVAIRADMTPAQRQQEWSKHFERLQRWDDFIDKLFAPLFNQKPPGT